MHSASQGNTYGTLPAQISTPATTSGARGYLSGIQAKLGAALVSCLLVGCILRPTHSPNLRPEDFAIQLRSSKLLTQVAENMDSTIDPCVDFYEYACGGFLKTATIPEDKTSIDSSFTQVGRRNEKVLGQIFNDPPPVIGRYFDSCVQQSGVVSLGIPPTVQTLLDQIKAVSSKVELFHVAALLAENGVETLFNVAVSIDQENPSVNVLYLSQGGLTFPSMEYYLLKDKIDIYKPAYLTYANTLLTLSGWDATSAANSSFNFEEKLASISSPSAALRDPWKTYNAIKYGDLKESDLLIWEFFNKLALDDPSKQLQSKLNEQHIVVTTPEYLNELNNLFNHSAGEASLQDAINYLSFRLLDAYAENLGPEFNEAHFAFHGKALNGLMKAPSREKFCMTATTQHLGALVGEVYLKKVFKQDLQDDAKNLVQELEKSLHDELESVPWLDATTRNAAELKLTQIDNLVGGPKAEKKKFSQLVLEGEFTTSTQRLNQYSYRKLLLSIGTPANRASWEMDAFTVNAYYDPSANKIVFPAAILQPPFYSKIYLPPAINYGGIGAVMGHELTHGFDDQGKEYDGSGKLVDWWSTSIVKRFDTRAACIVDQYSAFPVISIEGKMLGYVNGNLTLGENIADNGGLKLAYRAFKRNQGSDVFKYKLPKQLKALGHDKLFFIAYAQNWCERRRPNYAEMLRTTDPHSPGRWRTHGPLMNSVEFATTFQCPTGSPMNPMKKCKLW